MIKANTDKLSSEDDPHCLAKTTLKTVVAVGGANFQYKVTNQMWGMSKLQIIRTRYLWN